MTAGAITAICTGTSNDNACEGVGLYKKASENAQSRAVRSVVEATRNEHGVDPLVWLADAKAKRAALVERINGLTFQLASFNRQLGGKVYGSFAHALRDKLREKRDALREELAAAHVELTAVNAAIGAQKRELGFQDKVQSRREAKEEAERSFEREFFEMARRMLAKDVFDRIVVATIHAVGERGDAAALDAIARRRKVGR